MDYRVLDTAAQFDQAVEVEIAVWGLDSRDSVPPSMFRALTHAGGVAHGVYDNETMVGIALAFPAFREGKLILWSHMTGVLPAYQGRDIGFKLKQAQRQWALEHDFDEIGWTFDPLRRGNANFNLHRLGATASTYHVNFYGEMSDSINAGTPSDRLEVAWKLNESRVIALANQQPVTADYPAIQPENIILSDGIFREGPLSTNQAVLFAEAPASLSDSRLDAQAWRLALRQALQAAFAHEYTAEDFVKDTERYWYVLRQL